MNKFDKDRANANGQLLSLLCDLMQRYPSLRFGQILANFDFVKTIPNEDSEPGVKWADEFHLEPTELLERVQKCIDSMNNKENDDGC